MYILVIAKAIKIILIIWKIFQYFNNPILIYSKIHERKEIKIFVYIFNLCNICFFFFIVNSLELKQTKNNNK